MGTKYAMMMLLFTVTCEMEAYGQTCGSHLTSTTGEIVSPGFPANYYASLSCTWTIETDIRTTFIEFTIEEFELEDSVLCMHDLLKVHDGPSAASPMLLPPTCGTKVSWPAHPPTIRSTGPTMTIVFTSNGLVSATGFRGTFRQVSPSEDFFIAADKTNQIIYKQERSSIISEVLPVSGLHIPTAVDFDPIERKVYFTDVGSKFIGRIDIDGQNQETIATSNIGVPDGIAIDYVTRIVYWTDTGTDTISVARLNGTYRRILVQDNLYEPRDIIVQRNQGYIFWSDWGSSPKIEKSHGDGSNRISIVSSGLMWPNGIALNEIESKLYWADAGLNRIERCNLDGSQRELLKNFGIDVHPFGLAIAGDGIYWTDWIFEGIAVADRNFEMEPSTLIVNGINARFHGLAYYSSTSTNLPTRDCSFGQLNSGCEELCILVPSGMECLPVSPVFDLCPEDISISIREPTSVDWRVPSVSSPLSASVIVTSSHGGTNNILVPPSDNIIPVTYHASDSFGNTADCSFVISVTFHASTSETTVTPSINGTSTTQNQLSSLFIVIVISVIAVFLLATVVGVIFLKCVKFQSETGNADNLSVCNMNMTSMKMSKGVHCISPPTSHPLPQQGHPEPPVYTRYATGIYSTSADETNYMYMEITPGAPNYSHFLPGGTRCDVRPPLPPYRP